jgi:hypothetical protein
MKEPVTKHRIAGGVVATITTAAVTALWLGTCAGSHPTRNAETVSTCIEDLGGHAEAKSTNGRENLTSLIVGSLNGVEFEVRDYDDYRAAFEADQHVPVGHLVRRQGDLLVIHRETSDQRTARLITDCALVPR